MSMYAGRRGQKVLSAGVAMVTASAVALTPALGPDPVPHPSINLTAATHVLPQPVLPSIRSSSAASSSLTPEFSAWLQRVVLPSVGASFPAPPPDESVGATSINSAIKNTYNAVEPWVEWGFDVAAYAVGWIPWVGWFAPQISILYDFGEAIVRSIVFNTTDWLFGPLPYPQKISNIIGDTWDASWNLLWDEIGWLIPIPPIPLPPIPPCPQILCGGAIGDAVVTASGWLRDGSLWIWDLWDNPIKPVIDGGIGIANDIMDGLSWVPFVPLIKFETNSIWGLAQGVGDPLVYFAQDMIKAGDQAVDDFVHLGLGQAAVNATDATWHSITLRGGEAIDALVAFVQEQWDYFTGGFLDQRLSPAVRQNRLLDTTGLLTSAVDDLNRTFTLDATHDAAGVALDTSRDTDASGTLREKISLAIGHPLAVPHWVERIAEQRPMLNSDALAGTREKFAPEHISAASEAPPTAVVAGGQESTIAAESNADVTEVTQRAVGTDIGNSTGADDRRTDQATSAATPRPVDTAPDPDRSADKGDAATQKTEARQAKKWATRHANLSGASLNTADNATPSRKDNKDSAKTGDHAKSDHTKSDHTKTNQTRTKKVTGRRPTKSASNSAP